MNTQPEIHRLHPLVPPNVPEHKVLRCIGSGSYGEVWLAQHVSGAYRAVKFVSRQMFQRDRPFEREFTGMLKYEGVSRAHEGLVDVLQVGRDDAVFFYVMELGDDAFLGREVQPDRYMPKTLRSEIDQRRRLPFAECLQIALSLTSALGHLHRHGLVHRDVKPANVIFVNGQPKLADIGLVAEVHEARSYVGTEGFIPPEGPGTTQADLFGLGKTMYEMATGKDRKEFPALPTDLAGSPDHDRLLEFNEVILKACANDPSARYQTAAEMLSDLALLQSGKSVRHARALERRLETAKKLGRVAAVLALIAAAGYFFARLDARRARQAEHKANENLAKAYLAQARAGRLSGVPGQRVESLKAAAAAGKLQPSVELRNEAVAALALLDLEDCYWRERRVFFFDSFAFDHALERYAVGNSQGEITLYRVTDNSELTRLAGSKSGTRHIQFSPDGRFLAANFASTRLIVWNLATGVAVVNGKFGLVPHYRPCVFSPDGRTVGVRTAEPRIRFFDLTTGAELEPLIVHGPSHLFEVRPDGQALAVDRENDVEIWSLKTRTLLSTLSHSARIQTLAWHPDGRRLAVGAGEGGLYLWDSETRNNLELRGHLQRAVVVVFTHRGDVLASSSWDGTTRFWNVATGQQTLLSYGGSPVGFSPDDQYLAYGREEIGFGIWRVHRSTVFRKLSTPIGSSKRIGSVEMSADGRWLMAPNADGVHVWDFATDRLVYFHPARDTFSALFSGDGKSVIASSFYKLWKWPLIHDDDEPGFSFAPSILLATFVMKPWFPNTTTSGPNGEWLTFNDRTRVWTINRNELVPRLALEGKDLGVIAAISPDTNWLATTRWKGGPTIVWNLRNRDVALSLGEQGGSACFSPDGRWLVVGTGSEYAFYETHGWRKHHIVPRDSVAVTPGLAAFSRDGRMLALARTRRIVQIVDPNTGQEIVSLIPPSPQDVGWLAFGPGDQTFMAATPQGEIQVWDLRALRRELAALNLDWKQ